MLKKEDMKLSTIKKSLFFLAAACMLLIFASCSGGKGAGAGSDSDSSAADLSAETEMTEVITLCSDSIYTARGEALPVGISVSALPESIEGLYDRIEEESSDGVTQFHFMQGDDYIFTGIDFGEGKVDLLMANTFKVSAPSGASGDAPVTLSVPFSEVLALPGVVPEWVDFDDTGMWYWTWHGLWFAPDQSHLTPGLSSRLYNEEEMPRPVDFDDSVTVGYMGTGCPF